MLRKLEKIWLFLKIGSDVGGVADRQMMDRLYVEICGSVLKNYLVGSHEIACKRLGNKLIEYYKGSEHD